MNFLRVSVIHLSVVIHDIESWFLFLSRAQAHRNLCCYATRSICPTLNVTDISFIEYQSLPRQAMLVKYCPNSNKCIFCVSPCFYYLSQYYDLITNSFHNNIISTWPADQGCLAVFSGLIDGQNKLKASICLVQTSG